MNSIFEGLFGKQQDIDPEFKKWVESQYGPAYKISKDDLDLMYEDWLKQQQQQPTPNALIGR